MADKCPRCNWSIHDLPLTPDLEGQLHELLRKGERMRLVQKLYQSLDIDLTTAKGIMIHQNFEYGKCVNCGNTELQEERTLCPNCEAFNYNLDYRDKEDCT